VEKIEKYLMTKNIYLLFLVQLTIFYTNITNPVSKISLEQKEEKIYKNPFHENMWGVYMQKKQPLKSFQIFANLTKTNKYAYKWLINFLHKTGNNQKITSLVPLIQSTFPQIITDDPDIGFMVAYAISTSDITPGLNNNCPQIKYNQSAMDILIPLNRKFPNHQQVASLTATLYDLNNDPQNAIAVSEKYLNIATSKPTDFLEYFKNASRYLKISNKKLAFKNAKKCLDLQPKFNQGWVLLATIYDQLEKTQDAINACKKALELTGPNSAIEYMFIRLFFKLKGSQQLVSEFVMNKQCFEKAIELLRKKEYDKALDIMDKCLTQKQEESYDSSKLNINNINKNNKTELLKIKLIKNKPIKQPTRVI
jgi:tetratricopeptide (TPR) repeat protein